MSLRNAQAEETRESWQGYYSALAGEVDSGGFQKEFDKYTYVHTWHNSVRVIDRCAKMTDGARVLDAGCGWGRLLLGVLERYTSLNVTAVDLQEDALQIGRNLIGTESGGNQIDWQTGNLVALDLPDAEFDLVYSARVFQHLDDPAAGISELLRVLKPGGRFVLFLQNKQCPLNKNYYARMYTPQEVKTWFTKSRTIKLQVSTMDFYPGKLSGVLPLGIRMNIENQIGNIPIVNQYGGKVVAWGTK